MLHSPLGKGMKMVGRAVTVRFVPQRPDIGTDKPAGANSPEYEAFEKCGPKEVSYPILICVFCTER